MVSRFIDHEGRKLLNNAIPLVVGAPTDRYRTGVRLCWAQRCDTRLLPGFEKLQLVVRCAHDQPLCPELMLASKQKLAYALHCSYPAEDWFDDPFSEDVGFASRHGSWSSPHSVFAG